MLNNLRAFFKSFIYAFRGITVAILTQRNLRFHIVALIYVCVLSLFYNLSKYEYMILTIIFVLVISLELVNTAIESVVDLCSPKYNKLAEISKNCAAGAVLVSAIGAVIIGILMFGDVGVIKDILNYYREHKIYLFGMVIFTAISVMFVNYPFRKMKGK